MTNKVLKELHIKNFALITELYLNFEEGLNILTGETGAGKTIILEAMNLLIGRRADPVLIGRSADEALVEASIRRSDKDLVMSRTVTRDGNNKCYVDGRLATVTMLAELMDELVDFHGQHEHQALLRPASHLRYLDEFGGGELTEARARYEEAYRSLRALQTALDDMTLNERDRMARIDLLAFQVDEIVKAALESGEDLDLERELLRLKNAERLHGAVSASHRALAGEDVDDRGAIDKLQAAADELGAVEEIDEPPAKIGDRLRELLFEAEEQSHALASYLESIEFNDGRLVEIEERLYEINTLKKKYGAKIEDVLAFREEAEEELGKLTAGDAEIDRLKEEIEAKRVQTIALANELSELRHRYAAKLEAAVETELSDVNLEDCRFGVLFAADPELKPHGKERIEFLIAPNKGEDPKPLIKIASGGEVSRIMLALKIALTKADPVPILIFDEIDSGIGGKTAAAVGRKLAWLSRNHQIVCITHLPQIAAFADRHLLVSKRATEQRVLTTVENLDGAKHREELARMLSGAGISDLTRRHAAELIEDADKTKKGWGEEKTHRGKKSRTRTPEPA